ncbi:D-aminoacyl-tRNA deacylase [Halococcus agarilyticus]|uniref:D-aminoacyl-tRNA deacylase n=1 Tax=Halococcus agarilyticus TaxID=1232219 RepID=UPI000677F39B|nr:D-aminoacyl-tRNA deacylase [Halococcus agarilyticus]
MADDDATCGIVVSRADPASVHIGEQLLDLADWEHTVDDTRSDAAGGGAVYRTSGFELREFDGLHLDLEGVADAFVDPASVVFASKHAGDTGPLLTAHHTGNFGPADHGGADGAFASTCANAQARVLDALSEHAPSGYDVGMECTHHGPTDVGAPSMFVELGSSAAEWDDPEGARAVARAILDLRGVAPHRERRIVGFGGGHYVPRFERVVRETDWAVGHIGADWGLDAMGDPVDSVDVLRRAFERSGATRALVEGDRPALTDAIEDLGHEVVTETWLRETAGVPLDLVSRVEKAIGPIDAGLRFGDRARAAGQAGDEIVTVSLPAALLDEAEGIDPETARAAVERRAVAFDTDHGGSRLAGEVTLRDADDLAGIVDALADVLDGEYETVERREGALVARETAFDPVAARDAGVSEGPAFGRLAAGEAVRVDGETVDPATVHTQQERRFPLDGRDTRRTEGER